MFFSSRCPTFRVSLFSSSFETFFFRNYIVIIWYSSATTLQKLFDDLQKLFHDLQKLLRDLQKLFCDLQKVFACFRKYSSDASRLHEWSMGDGWAY